MIGGAILGKIVYDQLEISKAGAPFREQIDASADLHGVSANVLAAILFVESSFNPNAVGRDGEVGLGQFMPIAAEDVGVSIEDLKEDWALQIDAAARLLALNTQRAHGDVWAAVRAYNVGIGRALEDPSAGMDYAFRVFKFAIGDFLLGVLGGARA